MQYEIKVGSISWINDTPNPMYSTLQTQTLGPGWIPKTYLGLSGTSNSAPPATVADFATYQQGRDFRALTFCHFVTDIDETTGAVNSFSVVRAAHDGGWTPAFRMRSWPSSVFALDMDIYSITAYQGEYSPLSVVATLNRHANSTISTVPASETVLVNALIKFRAGSHTDNIGVTSVGCPFHVPWVWCEFILTYTNGRFKLHTNGSTFPSHAWYFNSAQVHAVAQAADSVFPVNRGPVPLLAVNRLPGAHLRAVPPPAVSIDTGRLIIYPVLSKGAPGAGPQQALSDESSRTGPVNQHPYTVAGGQVWSGLL